MKKVTFIALLLLIGAVLTGCTAKRLIKRGDASMLAGRPIEAERYYRKALGHDSDLAEKPEFVEKFTRARSQAAYKKGESLASQGLWEEAIARFSETLEIDPESAQAKQALLRARAKRDETERLYTEAANLAKQRQWDDAIRQAEAALRISPFHRPASDVLTVAKRSAADEHCDAGNRLLATGNLAEAEAEFQHSLGYVPALIPAMEGLARADYTRGVADQEKGLWGSAMLWYTDANNHISKPEYLSKIGVARSRILSRISFGVGVNTTDAGVWRDTESSSLRSRVLARVSARKPQFLHLESAKNIANPPSYTVTVSLEDLSVRGGLVRSENRTHYYTTYRKIPNPEIPRLRLLLQIARRDLARLRRVFNRQCHNCHVPGRHVCQTCRDTGKEHCINCRGTGRTICTKCRGKGKIRGRICHQCRGTGRCICTTCQGSGKVPCPTCNSRGNRRAPVQPPRRHGHTKTTRVTRRAPVPHPRRHGHTKTTRVTRRDIERKRAQVRRLQHQLAVAPCTITEGFSAKWPYVINHYEKSGVIRASIRITNAAGTTTDAITVRKTFRRTDTTIDNPNPRIGLSSDPLILCSDDVVRTSLIRAAGSEVATRIVAAVLKARASEIRAKAQNASRSGNSIDATEAYVDLAHLVRPYDATEAARLLERLHRQRR